VSAVVSIKQLLEAGVHFGHQTRRWNPKMKRFLHGERGGIYLIDLHQTLSGIERSYTFIRDLVADGGTVLFIGTKRQAQDPIERYARECNMPYINQRWLGGMLTNFETISKRVNKMKEYQQMRDSGEFEAMPKKEALLLQRELDKLERNLNGIRNLERLPDAVFILDTKKEDIAVTEANKLGIPVVAVVDTNCDPDLIQFVIPGNDDAIRSGELLTRVIADAVVEGRQMRARRGGDPAPAPVPAAPRERTVEEQAEHEAAQARARAEAAAAAQEREARLLAAREAPDDSATVTSAAEADADVAEAEAAVESANAEADADAVVAAETTDAESTEGGA
jgi:small subunit ribosomal protein S2